jgi:hypothetical protein
LTAGLIGALPALNMLEVLATKRAARFRGRAIVMKVFTGWGNSSSRKYSGQDAAHHARDTQVVHGKNVPY